MDTTQFFIWVILVFSILGNVIISNRLNKLEAKLNRKLSILENKCKYMDLNTYDWK
jgi:membrane-bound acyltransferase YfiQ involved in biofilm formation